MLALLLLAAPASAATSMSLDELAAQVNFPTLPRDVTLAPDEITISAALRDIMLVQPLPEGRELPTTIYRVPYRDLTRARLPFASVEYSRDCRNILVLQGEQAFAPDGVTYTRSWRRQRTQSGPWSAGWKELAPDLFPTGQSVPW